jgi:hypothetical protein
VNLPAPRTPKVKEFVQEPFWTCPDCGAEGTFGVLMICKRHYVRRCIHCWFDKSVPLPPLQKRIIYLDQFVISNMMMTLDPTVSKNVDGFYRTLFEKLDRLSKLQLIVCPESPIHDYESAVDPRYEKLRAVFRLFSHGIGFHPTVTILHAQIARAFRCRLNGEPCQADVERDFALTKNPDVWEERYRIEVNYTLAGLADSLKTRSELVTQHLHKVCERWKNEQNFDFKQTFADELAGVGSALFIEHRRYLAHYAAVSRGEAPMDDEFLFPPPAATLISRMLAEAAATLPDMGEPYAAIRDFFASQYFRGVSGARIQALFWATIARQVSDGRKNLPRAGMFNDIDAVAMYSPFCDAMFVDKETAHLTTQGELRKEFDGEHPRFFSLRERDELLTYLNDIEASASTQHLQLVEEVYGADWPMPYVDLLRNDQI